MRKRNKSKKKALELGFTTNPQTLTKAQEDIYKAMDKAMYTIPLSNYNLNKFFSNVGLIRRNWYTQTVHANVLSFLLRNEKLGAIKYIVDISREKDGDGRYGLKELKDFVDQFSKSTIVGAIDTSPVPVRSSNDLSFDKDIRDKVLDLIIDEIREARRTNGLSHLLDHVPTRVLQDYWNAYKY